MLSEVTLASMCSFAVADICSSSKLLWQGHPESQLHLRFRQDMSALMPLSKVSPIQAEQCRLSTAHTVCLILHEGNWLPWYIKTRVLCRPSILNMHLLGHWPCSCWEAGQRHLFSIAASLQPCRLALPSLRLQPPAAASLTAISSNFSFAGVQFAGPPVRWSRWQELITQPWQCIDSCISLGS